MLSGGEVVWGHARCLPTLGQFSTPNPWQENLGYKDFTSLYFLKPQPEPETAQEALGDAPGRSRVNRASACQLLGTPIV